MRGIRPLPHKVAAQGSGLRLSAPYFLRATPRLALGRASMPPGAAGGAGGAVCGAVCGAVSVGEFVEAKMAERSNAARAAVEAAAREAAAAQAAAAAALASTIGRDCIVPVAVATPVAALLPPPPPLPTAAAEAEAEATTGEAAEAVAATATEAVTAATAAATATAATAMAAATATAVALGGAVARRPGPPARVRAAFLRIDADGDGRVAWGELERGLADEFGARLSARGAAAGGAAARPVDTDADAWAAGGEEAEGEATSGGEEGEGGAAGATRLAGDARDRLSSLFDALSIGDLFYPARYFDAGRFNEAYAEMLFSAFDARGEGALDYTQAQQALRWLMRTPADGGAKPEVPLACPAEAYDAAGGLRLERPWFFMLYRTMP